eukprot:9160783-Pyramimonas_sp.AAC.1
MARTRPSLARGAIIRFLRWQGPEHEGRCHDRPVEVRAVRVRQDAHPVDLLQALRRRASGTSASLPSRPSWLSLIHI